LLQESYKLDSLVKEEATFDLMADGKELQLTDRVLNLQRINE
jgi:hypothetical protein